MEEFLEYWEEDRGVVIGGIAVGIALLLVLGVLLATLFGASPTAKPEVKHASQGPVLESAGKSSMMNAGSLVRVTATVGKSAIDSAKDSGPSVTAVTMERLLAEAEEVAKETAAEQAQLDADTQSINSADLEAAILALPQPATTDAIMGRSLTTVDKMVADFEAKGQPYPSVYATKGAATIRDWCQQCLEEATAEGVRAEVLYAQAMHETGYLQFGGQVDPSQCNFGGLGATNDGAAGATFGDVRTGLRAQVQHLKAYASTDSLKQSLVDQRFDLVERGCAPTVVDLNGRWAVPGTTYGQALLEIMNRITA